MPTLNRPATWAPTSKKSFAASWPGSRQLAEVDTGVRVVLGKGEMAVHLSGGLAGGAYQSRSGDAALRARRKIDLTLAHREGVMSYSVYAKTCDRLP